MIISLTFQVMQYVYGIKFLTMGTAASGFQDFSTGQVPWYKLLKGFILEGKEIGSLLADKWVLTLLLNSSSLAVSRTVAPSPS